MYGIKPTMIYIIVLGCVILWLFIEFLINKINKPWSMLMWGAVNATGLLFALYCILFYTVLGRTPSDQHIFTFFAPYTNEFYREMLMNAFLYFPFGLTLSTLLSSTHLMNSGENKNDVKRVKDKNGKAIGPVSLTISIGFLISVSIESWQYFAGTGLAQGTDVIMNTLGCAIGTIPWFIVRYGVVEKIRKQCLRISHRRTRR